MRTADRPFSPAPAGLTFERLSEINLDRCQGSFHVLDHWGVTDWACAAAGEMGEACNLIKKARRGEDIPASRIGEEIADTVIYLDLLAQRLGLRLGDEVRRKFDITSAKVGYNGKL